MISLTVLAESFVQRLPACLLGGSIIVALAALLLRVVGWRNAAVRFLTWFAALFGVAMLMVLDGLPPFATASSVANATMHGPIEVPSSWALYAFFGWALVSCMLLLRVAAGLWQVRRLRQTCSALNISILEGEGCARDRVASPFRRYFICVSERINTPAAVGFFRPAVILPSWLLKELSPTELKQVLLHEIAHLSRWDDWTNLVQKVLRAVLFFHPLVWWIDARLSLEREMACDDAVLRETQNPKAYARCLAALAERSYARRGLALAQAAVSRFRQTSMRVARIIHLGTPETARLWQPVLSVGTLVVFAGTISQFYTPRLFVFANNAQRAARVVEPIASKVKEAGPASPTLQPKVVSTSRRRSLIKAAGSEDQTVARLNQVKPKVAAGDPQAAEMAVGASGLPAFGVPDEIVPVKAAADGHAGTVYVVMETEASTEGVSFWQLAVWRVSVTSRQISSCKATPQKTI